MPITRQKSLIKMAELEPEDFLAQIKKFLSSLNIDIRSRQLRKVKQKVTIETDSGDFEMKGTSLRYLCFLESISCVTCGLTGNVIFIEKFPGSETPHANFYHRNENGELLLMTKDHIRPKGKGGRDCIDNLQTMCSACNEEKGCRC